MLVVFSIISHGHGQQVECLLRQIFSMCPDARVILTVNFVALEQQEWVGSVQKGDERLHVLLNDAPHGFAVNHNAAFAWGVAAGWLSETGNDVFCVLNPDISLGVDPLPAVHAALQVPGAGLTFVRQVDEHGQRQDYARKLPTPWQIFCRQVLGRREARQGQTVDWVNGAFMAFPARVYAELKGFDERYFLYGEDVDICLRLQLKGYVLVPADVTVVHAAQRRSTGGALGKAQNRQHLRWHLTSLLRLWLSNSYWRFLRLRAKL